MAEISLEADYLIVGAGAVGMAFADTLLHESDARIILVDRYAKPGGHWNVAYPFVTLHQPSAFYGVPSKELSKGLIDQTGLNEGLGDLATGAEIMAYYDEVMRQTFLPSGRVEFHGMSDYQGDGVFVSRLTGQMYRVKAKKVVDCTYLNTATPSTHTPNFTIAPGTRFMPLNDLPNVDAAPEGFTVIGGGKTGIDAVLWLLERGVFPDHIRWIMPRDAWLLDRQNTQPSMEFFENTLGCQADQFEAIAASDGLTDMFDRLEACGYFVRIDTEVRPQMFHGATVSQKELALLRQVKNIIRMGRVKDITTDRIVLEKGEIPTSSGVLHVDCSASAITNLDMMPIFQGDLITPQTVRSYQPVFSASFIAHCEVAYNDDQTKNRFCGVVCLPNHDTDYVRFTSAFMMNQYNWSQTPALRQWLLENRLDGFSKMVSQLTDADVEKKAIMKRLKAASMPAMAKLQGYIAELGAAS